MDAETRRTVKLHLDSARRTKLGLPDVKIRRGAPSHSSRAKVRWTEDRIRQAVGKVSGGKEITGGEYIARRKRLDPIKYPSYDTVKNRCPDLFI